MWVLVPLLLNLPAQVSIETTHQPVHIEGTKYIWVKPAEPLRARVVADDGDRLAIDFARVGKVKTRKQDLVRVQQGKKKKRTVKLRAELVDKHDGRLGTQYTSLPVRHWFDLETGTNTVLVRPDKKRAPDGVLVRLFVRAKKKSSPAPGAPIALAPLKPPEPAAAPQAPPPPPPAAEPAPEPPPKVVIVRKKKKKKRKKRRRPPAAPAPRAPVAAAPAPENPPVTTTDSPAPAPDPAPAPENPPVTATDSPAPPPAAPAPPQPPPRPVPAPPPEARRLAGLHRRGRHDG